MNLLFLGTGAGVPAKSRNVTSIALQLHEERNAVWLFDCGEATQHQILNTALKPGKIEKIFITHLHGDHIYGLPGLISSRSFQGGSTELTIYGPPGIEQYIRISLEISKTHLKYPLTIVEIEEGTIFEDDTFTVVAGLLDHGVDSYGFRVIEKDLPGELQVEDLQKLGVRPGPVYRRLKNGETVTLEDGRVLSGADYVGKPKQGRIVTILGDTRTCENSLKLSRSSDCLVHEATFARDAEGMAYDYFHSTTSQAARTAAEANVKQLVLTHISSRYMKEDMKQLAEEAKAIFSDTVIAEDFMSIEIKRQRS
ncbi:MAG: ribonuclease Z [Bacillus sp. (in: firmicutes)]